ncbi:MAG: glutathione peroxidase [Erysipelotrichaceae bacterium]|nr:glutathione peroxidase [Erysipelotrichaceae bacterium]MDY6035450.1 glutathione peroxidase [Bulleidia sp.]
MSFYDYTLTDRNNNEVSMKDYAGKVVLVVNTATGCGFTPQYKDLEEMYEKYHDQGLEIIDVPCNQFAGQTPGTDEEVHEFCTLKYNTQFDQFKKSDVNGEHALPLFTFLKNEKSFEGFGNSVKALSMRAMCKLKDPNYKKNPDIKWNFTKFLIDRDGNVVRRFEPTEDMNNISTCIQTLI